MPAETSVIDLAHQAMEASPGDEAARLRFYALIADSALLLMLNGVEGASLRPEVFELEAGRFVMVFDREERLAAFAGAPVEHATLPGRVIVAELQGQGIGIGLNLGVAASSFLMGPEAVDWLAATLQAVPEEAAADIAEVTGPGRMPEALMAALDVKLALMAGTARQAVLAGVRYRDGRRGHVLAVIGAARSAEAALAKAVGEAVVFSGLEAGSLDVLFPAEDAPATAALRAHGIVFDLPVPVMEPLRGTLPGAAPGMDPARPPRLR